MAELKPCPFCGGRLGVANEGHKDDCYIMLLLHGNVGPREITAAWNRRATDGQRAGVPEGWKLVPVEPTHDMLVALSGEWHSSRNAPYRAKYTAMLAAAPTPPAGDAGQERDWRDAERYLHVRAHGMPKLCPAGFYYHDGVFYPTADAAIDAYMAASKGEKG